MTNGDRVGVDQSASRIAIGEKYDAASRMVSEHSKFANGAATAAFVAAFSEIGASSRRQATTDDFDGKVTFEGPDATPEAQARVKSALVDIANSGTEFGDRAYAAIMKNGITVRLEAGVSTAAGYGNGFIQLDPTAQAFVGEFMYSKYGIPRSEVPTGRYADAIVLGHEIGHAVFNYDDPYTYSPFGDPHWIKTNVSPQQNVLTYENRLRRAFGSPDRNFYHGNPNY
ncbi:MAG: hypothetical protein AAF546_02485 [Verrucomicrobiota bacterium]